MFAVGEQKSDCLTHSRVRFSFFLFFQFEENGLFHYKCDGEHNNGDVCPAQTAALLNVNFVWRS
jgi:hypothetical protein